MTKNIKTYLIILVFATVLLMTTLYQIKLEGEEKNITLLYYSSIKK